MPKNKPDDPPDYRRIIRTALLHKFPWLGTDDPVDCAGVIDSINEWFQTLKKSGKQLKAKAEFVDTKKEFKWRIHYGKEVSPWYFYYPGLLVHKFSDGRTFALATSYWEGSLPVAQPFEIFTPQGTK